MSFELLFYAPDNVIVGETRLDNYFSSKPNFAGKWSYENPDTGVYCLFDFLTSKPKVDELKIVRSYSKVPLTFSLNYARPRFFALETLPLVEALCNHLGILVIDPQAQGLDNFFAVGSGNS